MGISNIFDIGRSALAAAQQAMAVTSHNIANVSTPGYSRQVAVLTENTPNNATPGQIGTGVQVTEIRRQVNTFLESQITESQESVGRFSVMQERLAQIEQLFSGTDTQGLAARINDFFNAVQDVATNPSDLTARTVLLAKAASLSSQFHMTADNLASTRQALNGEVGLAISQINDLSTRIADLNGQIARVELTGQRANDLRDQRTQLVNSLASQVDVSIVEKPDGALSVFVGRGLILVDGQSTRRLVGMESADNNGLLDVRYDAGGNALTSVSSLITNGRLRGLLDLRDGTVSDLQQSVDSLAGSLANEVNQLHRAGFGLDGTTGLDFFSSPSVTTRAVSSNTGTAAVSSAAIVANSLLTFHDYEIRFSSATSYSIVDADTGATIKGNYAGTVISAPTADAPVSIVTGTNDTLTLTVDGLASGTITLTGAASPGVAYTSGASLAAEIQTRINADATLSAAGKGVTVVYDTTTNRFVVTSNSTQSTSAINITGGTARSSLGFSSGIATAASGTYGSPQTLVLDGIALTLGGTPTAGDVLAVNSREAAAERLSVSVTDASKVAASASRSGLPDNGENALAIGALQQAGLRGLGGATADEYYRSMASRLGIQAQTADQQSQAQDVMQQQLESYRSQASGVSLDEELVNLLQYQRLFQAASRLIVTSDELLQTILTMKR